MQAQGKADEHGVPESLVVRVLPDGDEATAEGLARRLGVSASHVDEALATRRGHKAPESDVLALCVGADGLSLESGELRLLPDLSRMLPRIRQGRLQQELLVRAAKVRMGSAHGAPHAIDATAGMGEDSLLLAAAGFEVTLYERDPVLAALLSDSLRRAALVPELEGPVSRMRLVEGDSIRAMRELAFGRGQGEAGGPAAMTPDVVLLDPMFPERRKSAAVHKKAQLLQRLESPCDDEEELLAAALATGARKVVVKRPAKGPTLAGTKPSYSIRGKAVRYDVIVLPRA